MSAGAYVVLTPETVGNAQYLIVRRLPGESWKVLGCVTEWDLNPEVLTFKRMVNWRGTWVETTELKGEYFFTAPIVV